MEPDEGRDGLLAGAVDVHRDCVYRKDRSGRYVALNTATAAALGVTEQEAVGHTDAELLPRGVAEVITNNDRRVLAGESLRIEDIVPHRDGTLHRYMTRKQPVFDEHGAVCGLVGISTDITAEGVEPGPVTDSELRLRTTFENAPIGQAVVALDGRLLQVNPALCRLLERTETELLAQRCQDVTYPDDVERFEGCVADALSGGPETFDVEQRCARADGTQLPVSVSMALVRGADGSPQYFVAQVQDVSERAAAQRQLEEALAASESANAALLAAYQLRDQLLSVTSHELRTPLTSILGFAQTLSGRWGDLTEAQRLEAVASIHRQARRLSGMVDDLLLLSANQAGELGWRPTTVALEDLWPALRHAHPELEVCETAARVHADRDRLVDMLQRLVDNAFQHGAAPVRVEVRDDADSVVVVISDSGPGVPERFVPQLFATFAQADTGLTRRTRGAGLGLAVVQALAELAGAEVWYEPGRPAGACFCVRLPRAGGH